MTDAAAGGNATHDMSATAAAPIDIPTAAVAAFCAAWLPVGARVLEVGCGDGTLAATLNARGLRVTGLDADAQAVAAAQARGVAAQRCDWPDYAGAPVDAVAFTRSLHHIAPLDAAVARAHDMLVPDGVLLLDDFAHEAADARTLGWFATTVRRAPAEAPLAPLPHAFATLARTSTTPLDDWRARHADHVHPFAAMTTALAAHFDNVQVDAVPYLYRYLVQVLPATATAAAWTAQVLDAETRGIAAGTLTALGRRLVARRR